MNALSRIRRFIGEQHRLCYSNWKSLASKNKIKELHNKHFGKRGFVVGLGSSLLAGDLDKLTNEITISCNKCYLLYDKTNWRPTYYSLIDLIIAKDRKEEIAKVDSVKIMSTCVSKQLGNYGKDVIWVKELIQQSKEEFEFSTNLEKGIYGGCSVTFDMLQIAWHLGLNPIYLIGVQHDIMGKEYIQTNIAGPYGYNLFKSGDSRIQKHCVPNYYRPGELVASNVDEQKRAIKALEKVAQIAKENNRQILNASRLTYLDMFPRINLDDVLSDG